MVLLILAVIWAAVLIPPLLRARAEGRPADSIGNFKHQLHVLERAAPGVVTPAHSLRVPAPPAAPETSPSRVAPVSRLTRPQGREAARRARTLKRRRDTLVVLLVAMAGSLGLALFPQFRLLWVVHAVFDAMFVAYVALLVRIRNIAAERDMKLRFLPRPAQPEPALLLRRSAN